MDKVYIPQAVKDGKFKGTVLMTMLSYDERMELADWSESMTSAGVLKKMSQAHKGKWVKVDLERVSDGVKFADYASLQYGPDCHKIITEVYTWLIQGDAEEEKPSAP